MKLLRAAMLAVAVSLAACSTPMKPMQDQSLYQRLGGKEAITAVVDDFIGNVAADPAINRRFAGALKLQLNLGHFADGHSLIFDVGSDSKTVHGLIKISFK